MKSARRFALALAATVIAVSLSLALASPAAAVTYTLSITPNEFDAYPGETGVPSEPTPAQVVVTEDGGPVSVDTFVAIGSSDASKLTVDGGGVTIPAGQTTTPILYTAMATGQTTLTANLNALTANATADVIPSTAPKMSVTPFRTVNKKTGTTQNLAANFSLPGGITPSRVRWTVTGANSVGPTDVTANSPNESDFSYMGSNPGTDTVTVCYDPDNDSVCDNTKHATVTWAAPTATTSPGSLNFGSHVIGTQSTSMPVTLTNTGSVPVSVGSALFVGAGAFQFTSTADGCSNTTVAVAGHCTIDVAMAPSATGAFTATLQIPDDTAGSPHGVALSGTGTPASPTISTAASHGVVVGKPVRDTATLASGYNPTGQISFNLFRPSDATCSKLTAFHTTKSVSGNGNYVSSTFIATKPGTYRWTATYSGDANNNSNAGACGDAGESVTVRKASPKLSTTASGSVVLGGKVHDTATLSAGYNPIGKITFRLYGPGDKTCSRAPAFQTSKSVAGNGSYRSPNFTPTSAGMYRWRAFYSGDARNNPRAGACNAAGESVTVTRP